MWGNKYKSVQELRSSNLASFSGTFDLILFQAVNFEFIVEKVWFSLVWNILIKYLNFNLICEFVLDFVEDSTDKQTY